MNYDIKDANADLRCSHWTGKGYIYYTMPCIVLGKTKSGKIKVVVFGERFWKGRKNVKRIRYVEPERVKVKERRSKQ